MKITAIKTAVLVGYGDWILLRVETDEGITGLGECFPAVAHAARPVVEMTRIRVYADCGAGEGLAPAPYAEKARAAAAQGFSALKFNIDAPVAGLSRRRLGRGSRRETLARQLLPVARSVCEVREPRRVRGDGRARQGGPGGRAGEWRLCP